MGDYSEVSQPNLWALFILLKEVGCFPVCIQLFIYSHFKRNVQVNIGIELNCIYSISISKFQENVVKASKGKKKKKKLKPDPCIHFVAKINFCKNLELEIYVEKPF